jgi:hypothetical protein
MCVWSYRRNVENVIVVAVRVSEWFSKNYKIGICCFSAKQTALRGKSKYWLAQYQINVPVWRESNNNSMKDV